MAQLRMVMVRVPPHADPALVGKARVRKPWQRDRFFTEEPTEVEYGPQIARMLMRGDLVMCDAPPATGQEDDQ